MNNYYVYAYLNPLIPGKFVTTYFSFLFKPFYIGSGKNLRLFDHLKEARPTRKFQNNHKLNTIRKLLTQGENPVIIKIIEFITKVWTTLQLTNTLARVILLDMVDRLPHLGPSKEE